MNFTRWDWQLVIGESHLLFLDADRVGGRGGEKAIGNGWGCLSYLSGIKVSDLVPFTVSQNLVDYQRPSWYLIGCFSLNKMDGGGGGVPNPLWHRLATIRSTSAYGSPQLTWNVFFTTTQGNDLRYATSVFSITMPKSPTSERFQWAANLLASM